MGFKCAPQLIGMVRGEPKAGAKHRADGMKIAQEAGNERYSKSETLDRTRSIDNVYTNADGYKSGKDVWNAMCKDAAEYRVKGKTKNGKDFERGLRHDAVIGYAVVFNPPEEVTPGWTDQDYYKFAFDSFTALGKIEPRLFRADNVRFIAFHKDEGDEPDENGEYSKHIHMICDAKDKEGNYCGNKIDPALYERINKEYPRLMREKGWDLEDLDITDFKRCATDEEYRKERNEKRKKFGKSVNAYRKREELAKLDKQLVERTADLDRADAEVKARELERDAVIKEMEKLAEEKAEMKGEITTLAEQKSALEEDICSMQTFADLIRGLKHDRSDLKAIYETLERIADKTLQEQAKQALKAADELTGHYEDVYKAMDPEPELSFGKGGSIFADLQTADKVKAAPMPEKTVKAKPVIDAAAKQRLVNQKKLARMNAEMAQMEDNGMDHSLGYR